MTSDAPASGPITRIVTDGAPRPAGHYSQATVAGGNIYVSGQLPIAPDGAGDPTAVSSIRRARRSPTYSSSSPPPAATRRIWCA